MAHVYGLCGRLCVIVLMKIIRIANECVSVYISIVYVNMYKCAFVCVCVRRNFCPSVLILVFPTAFFPPSHSHVGRPVVRCIGQRGDALVRSAVRPHVSTYFSTFHNVFFFYSNSRRYCRARDHDTRRHTQSRFCILIV